MRRATSSLLALTLAMAAGPPAVHAQQTDPAAAQIEKFDAAVLDVMKQAKKLGTRGRYDALQPVIERTFDLPAMTRFAVGSAWNTLSPEDKAAVVKAFTRMTVATYAHNFDSYGGEKFSVEKVDTRGLDKLVRTRLTGSGAPTQLAYRMRQDASGAWKVIDVYYNSTVSSLLGQRSEYAATLSSGGVQALIRKLNSRADQLIQSR
jgi:phospholipid transport system substrate-binding protein|nr:phospholipid transport system substrate-binding protein [Phenylobacterium sp.]